jgi:ABC-type nitrate/sulfonate/bicarbonate transport system ATPase subunit
MLRLEEITKRFANGTLALEGINLEVAPQTIVGIVGVSGSGKSTLLRLISGLDAFNRLKLQNHLLKIWAKDRTTLLVVTHDVEEALVFSDRVIVLAGHPGRISEDFFISLPRPRRRTDPEFQSWKQTILAALDPSLLEESETVGGVPGPATLTSEETINDEG